MRVGWVRQLRLKGKDGINEEPFQKGGQEQQPVKGECGWSREWEVLTERGDRQLELEFGVGKYKNQLMKNI